jgi:retron-type reverse transcriptase
VVAKLVYRSIVKRNLRAFSPDSYAYLPDRDIFDAIQALGDTNPHEKTFAIQVDFKKFFDNIPHEFLDNLIGANSENRSPLRITSTERRIIKAFMSHESEKTIVKKASGATQKIKEKRSVGTPQGSSVSLILANLALHDLDKSLQLKSGKFVRYADDVVALTNNYEQALQVEQAFYDHAHKNALEINRNKSPGISAFSETEQEIRTTGHIDFLGYRFTPRGTTISDQVEEKIKLKIGRLVNLYLIQYIRGGELQPRQSERFHASVRLGFTWFD